MMLRRAPAAAGPFLARRAQALGLFGVCTALVLSMGLLATAAPVALAAEGGCPNEAIRKQQGTTNLPDCRAYELVSPEGAQPEPGYSISSVEGDAVSWVSHFPPLGTAGDSGGQVYLSRRGPSGEKAGGGWATITVTPPQSAQPNQPFECIPSMYFSPTMTRGILSANIMSIGLSGDGREPCQSHNEPALLEAPNTPVHEPEGAQSLFATTLGASGTTFWTLVNQTPADVTPASAWLEDASTVPSEEFSHVLFVEQAALTENAPAPPAEDLYESAGGKVRLITYRPDGEAVAGSLANDFHRELYQGRIETGSQRGAAAFTNAMSADGSRVFFETEEGSEEHLHTKLFVRLHAEAEPSKSELTPNQCVASAQACTIQVDASQAGGAGGGATFLAANPSGTRVFFVDEPTAQLTANTVEGSGANLYEYEVDTGNLIDLTGGQADAEVLGYSGFGESGGVYHLYFVATGQLVEGQGAAGQPNLYEVSNEDGTSGGVPRFVATLSAAADARDWGRREGPSNGIEELVTRASPDGRFFTFVHDHQLFLYQPGAGAPPCISCTAYAPNGSVEAQSPTRLQFRAGPGYLNRAVLNSGQVFFTSEAALVNEDGNGVDDVYEYDGGAVHLISSGVGVDPAVFEDASANGQDVFFLTGPQVPNSGGVLYDARQEGGFLEQSTSECEEFGCRPGNGTGPPAFTAPASAAFAGVGNIMAPAGGGKRSQGGKHAGGRPGKAKTERRHRKLRKALQVCKRRYRHNRHKRRECKRRSRKRYGGKAKGLSHHAKRHRRGHRHEHRHRHHGGAR